MPKILEEDGDSDFDFKTNNEYAKNYDNWRKKEELNKLKTKYGEDSLQLLEEDSSSSSEDDDDAVELNEETEKQFFKTLSCLKNKDPRIYDENVKFFNDSIEKPAKAKNEKKEKPMYINDYERELILKNNGEFSESEEDPRAKSPTYVEEQKKIKESLKEVLDQVTEEDEEGEWGGMLKARQKTEEEKIKEEADYKEWLAGQKEQIEDKEAEAELKPLKDYWSNPNLDDGEKFLRDYILQKKFLSKEDEDYIPTYEEIVHDSDKDLSDDEEAIEKQEEFEHKYNFRFEEPDQEFIKRYPRTMEQSLRKTDDRRKLKRAETKERKQKEKQKKMQELKELQDLKRKEIEEKIQKLKEITGNSDIGFKDEDLDGDFDPEAHDKRMQSLFNEEFYEGAEEEQKPEFPEIDEYLELENWEKWKADENTEGDADDEVQAPHCEDEDFNMDCDYDPKAAVKEELIASSKGKKKRKRKSLFAKALSEPKPVFDPKDKTYEEYLDEYYKLDCEDIIGDLPCKFKYRKVVPNDFGLTVEEILTAKDRELNKWCSLKKAVQIRPVHVEKYDQIAFAKKANNIELKKKVLPSLFENEQTDKVEGNEWTENKKRKRFGKKADTEVTAESSQNEKQDSEILQISERPRESSKKKKKPKNEVTSEISQQSKDTNALVATKKQKRKKKKAVQKTFETQYNENGEKISENKTSNKKKLKKNMNNNTDNINNNSNNGGKLSKKRKRTDNTSNDVVAKKLKKRGKDEHTDISDARLSAYGINPKKFKNKLKYKK